MQENIELKTQLKTVKDFYDIMGKRVSIFLKIDNK